MSLCLMLFALGGCMDDWEEEDSSESITLEEGQSTQRNEGNEQGSTAETAQSSVKMTVGEGELSISRPERTGTNTAEKKQIWTFMIYLCGTDLETENGLASIDIEEMKQASLGGKVRFLIQTGGTKLWETDEVSASSIQRSIISGGKLSMLEEKKDASMGDSATLAGFLKWGVTKFPSEHTGVVLWNHGGGSISGVCFDERYNYDSLTLRELDAAFLSAFESMDSNFDFIGFDACLMATAETANIVASYADYMYASEETEPGYGWDYAAIGNYITQNPNANGAEVGRVVADSFYECCDEIDQAEGATFSIIDLKKYDSFMVAFNTYAKELYEKTEDADLFAQAVRAVRDADNFGGNNRADGYTNMVDMAGIIMAGSDFCGSAKEALKTLNDAFVYVKNGSDHREACGLSTYYPLSMQGSEELATFGKIAISPYYLAFVDRTSYGAVNEGNLDRYNDEQLLNSWGDYDYTYNDEEEGYFEADDNAYGDYWDYFEDYSGAEESTLISFLEGPGLYDDGTFGFQLTQEALSNTAGVQAAVYVLSEDEEDLIEYGLTVDICMDWQTGEFYDNFDGFWFSLPDGQNLAVYSVAECDGYDIYSSPVLLNGEEMNLRIIHDYEEGYVFIECAYYGIDENGMASKESYTLQAGDVMIPLYNAFAIESDEEYYYYGEEYEYDGDGEIFFDYLYDGDYLYGFNIDDVYGNFFQTDFVWFTVDGEDIYYWEE